MTTSAFPTKLKFENFRSTFEINSFDWFYSLALLIDYKQTEISILLIFLNSINIY